jgi:hypothetical protein
MAALSTASASALALQHYSPVKISAVCVDDLPLVVPAAETNCLDERLPTSTDRYKKNRVVAV